MEQVLFPEHLCKIINECNEQPQSYERLKCPKSLSAIKMRHLENIQSQRACDVIVLTHNRNAIQNIHSSVGL